MINIVGKVMLADIPRGCQDEYAAVPVETRRGEVSRISTWSYGERPAVTIRVNLNREGRAIDARGVKQEKATPV
jgi:hypothetical protein